MAVISTAGRDRPFGLRAQSGARSMLGRADGEPAMAVAADHGTGKGGGRQAANHADVNEAGQLDAATRGFVKALSAP